MLIVHIVDTNLDPTCGAARPTHWMATALTLAAAEGVAEDRGEVCKDCRRIYLEADEA
jgi:hypothetical protein